MDIPEALINFEQDKMIDELKHNIEHQGIEFSKYLADLKKTEDDLKKIFTIKRLKNKNRADYKRNQQSGNVKISDDELSKR